MSNLRRSMEMLARDCTEQFGTSNIHSILGVSHESDADEIRSAIRSYLRRNHPDKAGIAATGATQIVTRFNTVLRDANSFLTYILLPQVRSHYLNSSVKMSRVDQQLGADLNKLKRDHINLQEELSRVRRQLEMTRNQLAMKEETLSVIKCELREKATELEGVMNHNKDLSSQMDYFKTTLEQKQQELNKSELRYSEQLKIKNEIIHRIENKLNVDVNKLEEVLSNEQWSHLDTQRRLRVKEEQLNYLKNEVREKMKQLTKGKDHLIDLLNTINSELRESYMSLVKLASPSEREHKSLLDRTIDQVRNKMSRNRRKLTYLRTRIQRESVRLWILGDRIVDILCLTKIPPKRTVYTPPNSLISSIETHETTVDDERSNPSPVISLTPPQRPSRKKNGKWLINSMCVK